MSTYMAKKETVERKWYVIDAAGKPLGKTAVTAQLTILRGKHRPEFTPHVDCGEFVIIINAAKAVLTGKKLDQKFYRHHSGYIGGLKEVQLHVPLWQRSRSSLWSSRSRVCSRTTPSATSSIATTQGLRRRRAHKQQAQKPVVSS